MAIMVGAPVRVHGVRVKGLAPPPPYVVVRFCYSHPTRDWIGTVEAWTKDQHSLSSERRLVLEMCQGSKAGV